MLSIVLIEKKKEEKNTSFFFCRRIIADLKQPQKTSGEISLTSLFIEENKTPDEGAEIQRHFKRLIQSQMNNLLKFT